MTARPGRSFLVLDVDDTLVATFSVGLAKCRRVAASLRLPSLTHSDYAAAYGRMSFDACVAHWYPEVRVAEFAASYDALADELQPVPLGDLAALVSAAREAGFGVGVLTNGPGTKTERKLAAAGLPPADLDFVRTADNTRAPKPAASAFDALVADGVQPDRSWYVSDSAADWAGCAVSGFRSVGVPAAAPTACGRQISPDLAVPGVDALTGAMTHLAGLPPRVPDSAPSAQPTAIGFDAGFTVIEDVEEPLALVVKMLGARGVHVTSGVAAEAFASSMHWLQDSSIWADTATIDATLVSFYREVVRRVGGEVALDARHVVDAYVAPRNWRSRAGAAEALDQARRAGVRVGFLSNWQPGLSGILGSVGLLEADDSVVSSAEVGVAKPSPAAFDALAQALGVGVRELVYVGDDAASDAAGALAAGCRAVLVPRSSPRERLAATVRIALPEVSQPASTA